MIAQLSFIEKSELFAKLSKLSYEDEESVKKEAKKLGFTKTRFYNRDGAQAYFFSNKTDCVVACRGTEPTQFNDLKADLKAFPVKSETVSRVHRGFKTEVDDLWPMVKEDVLKIKNKNLWFCGHSLGAAMATVMASRCGHDDELIDATELYTYGSPRVGWKKYVDTFKTPHNRWVNNNDIVTRVPLALMMYRHDGTECYINAYGQLRTHTLWQRIKDRFRGLWFGLKQGKIDSFSDHSMDEYLKHIETIKEN